MKLQAPARRAYAMVRRAEAMDLTRRAIVEAALRTLLAPAGAELTLESVADEAGVGRATIYRHFGSREALLRAVVADVWARSGLEPVLAGALAAESLSEAVRGFVAVSARFWEGHGRLVARVLALAADDPEIAAMVAAKDASRARDAARLAASFAGKGSRRDQVTEVLVLLTSFQAFDFLSNARGLGPRRARAILERTALAALEEGRPWREGSNAP